MFIDEGYIKARKVSDTYRYYFNKKIDEKDGFWKYQISLFNMLYYEIGQGTGELCLNDFNNFKDKSNKNISLRKLFFSLSLGLEDELLARGYKKEIVEKQWGILNKIMLFILISLKLIFIIKLPIVLVTLGKVNIFLVAFAYSLVLLGFFTQKKMKET